MIPRDTRQLYEWLENNPPSKLIGRIIMHGKRELLGAFKPAPNSLNPGWVVRVTSPLTKKEWYVVVALHMDTGKLNSYIIDKGAINFNNYCGGNSPLYRGDYGGKLRNTR